MWQPVGTEFPTSMRIDEPKVQTNAKEKRGVVDMLRSSRDLMVFVFMLVIFTGAAQPIIDPDFWWHLRTGQYIAETKSIPYEDIFSTVRFGSEWVTHEWLSELFMYSIFRALGYGGLIVVFSIIVTAAFWITYQRCRKRAGHPYVIGFALLLGAAATMPTWGVRPQIFSLLFASIFISFLDKYCRQERMPSIWWLAPLLILWVNMHAGFALGLVLIVLTIAGLFLDGWLLRNDSFADVWRLTRPLIWLLLICVAAVSLNPNGARLYTYPFQTLTSEAMMQYIREWKSPDFHNPMFQALALLIIATFSALALSNKRTRPGELLTLAVTAWATLRSGRNAAFFALVATPLLAEHTWTFVTSHHWGRWLDVPEQRAPGRKPGLRVGLNVLFLALALTVVASGILRAVEKQPATEMEEFPAAAVDFIQEHKAPQPIYNEYTWGGYLIWRLFPGYRVYIDGRADVYGDSLVEEWLAVHDGKPAWRAHLESRGIRTVLVKPDVALASLLRQDTAWQNIFEDKQAVVFVRR